MTDAIKAKTGEIAANIAEMTQLLHGESTDKQTSDGASPERSKT